VEEFTDDASGNGRQGSQFQATLEAASRREFDAVVFWSLVRFTREGTLPTLRNICNDLIITALPTVHSPRVGWTRQGRSRTLFWLSWRRWPSRNGFVYRKR